MNQVVAIDDKDGRLAMRASIEQYQSALQEVVGERGDMDEVNDKGLQEFLVGGAYTRVLKIPAGHTIVSALWKKERLWIIVHGTVHVRTETGDETITGPDIRVAPFGSKVVIYAETDVLWAAITGVTETEDIDAIEQYAIAEGYESLAYPWDKLEDKSCRGE